MILLHITNGVEVIRYVTHHLYSNINQVQLLIDDIVLRRVEKKRDKRRVPRRKYTPSKYIARFLSRFYMML